jgi:predicted ATPase
VFAGGCTLEAAEAVCNADGDLPVDVLDGIESLVGKSLLRQEEGAGGEPRVGMLETVHEYAGGQLAASGAAATLRRRHARYFLGRPSRPSRVWEAASRRRG